MSKKFSDVYSSIKYAKLDPKHDKPHKGGSTDDEEHGAVSELEFGQQVAHAKKRSMTENEEFTQEQIDEAIDHVITAKQIISQSKSKSSGNHEYMKFLKSLRDKFGKEYSTNVHQLASKMATEEVEQLDELSKDTLKSYREKAHVNMFNAAGKAIGAIQRKDKPTEIDSRFTWEKRIRGINAVDKKLKKEEVSEACWTGYVAKGTKKKNGKEVPNCVPVNEAFSASASNKTHVGEFVEKEHGKSFTYKKTNDAWAKKHNLPHEIDVHDGVRYGHVKGTVAHVATDENPDGTPKIEKWKLKKHSKWMKESKTTDIVRDAFEKAKKKKKNDKSDNDVTGKTEKFQSDPVMTDTIEKL